MTEGQRESLVNKKDDLDNSWTTPSVSESLCSRMWHGAGSATQSAAYLCTDSEGASVKRSFAAGLGCGLRLGVSDSELFVLDMGLED